MSSRLLFLLCFVAMPLFSGCRHDPYSDLYLKNAPPRQRLCGTWVIDPQKTTWREARPLLDSGSVARERGHLDIRSNGRYSLEHLPDFSIHGSDEIANLENASGSWRIRFDPMNELSYLWLDFEEVDDEPATDKHAMFLFRREGADYLLHAIISDPDSGDAFVMRKGDKRE